LLWYFAFNIAQYSGTIGALISITTQDDLNTFFNAKQTQDYGLVLPQRLLIPANFEKLQQSDHIKGIVLTKDELPSQYSLESRAPNLKYGLYPQEQTPYQWNPKGLDLLSKSSSKPIFQIVSLNDFNSSQGLSKAIDYNKALGYSNHPLYNIEFQSNMYAIDNAETCLRRKHCDPIGEKSIWSTFSNLISLDDKKPIVFVTSKFDSNALFRDLSFGHSQITGSLVLLSVVNALSKFKSSINTLPKHILFSLFGAETFGHSGSQRFVQDISAKGFQCKSTENEFCEWNHGSGCSEPCYETLDYQKINFENIGINLLIETVVDIDTVGLLHGTIGANVDFFMHVDQINPENTNLINAFKGTTTANGFNGTEDIGINLKAAFDQITNNRLPPSPAMAFLQKKASISSIVISDYQTEYSNP
jgi:nicastrin